MQCEARCKKRYLLRCKAQTKLTLLIQSRKAMKLTSPKTNPVWPITCKKLCLGAQSLQDSICKSSAWSSKARIKIRRTNTRGSLKLKRGWIMILISRLILELLPKFKELFILYWMTNNELCLSTKKGGWFKAATWRNKSSKQWSQIRKLFLRCLIKESTLMIWAQLISDFCEDWHKTGPLKKLIWRRLKSLSTPRYRIRIWTSHIKNKRGF